jgi:hypothetical protein
VTTVGVDEASFGTDTSLPPFGTWDAGVKLTNLSQQQVRGIDEGETGTFTFNLLGADAGTLNALSFFTNKNSGGGLTGAFAVRYQSVGANANQSDKVMGMGVNFVDVPRDPGDDTPPGGGGGGGGDNNPPPQAVPLPPAVWAALATMGMGGLNALRRRKAQ